MHFYYKTLTSGVHLHKTVTPTLKAIVSYTPKIAALMSKANTSPLQADHTRQLYIWVNHDLPLTTRLVH
jgi:hypothetical protein